MSTACTCAQPCLYFGKKRVEVHEPVCQKFKGAKGHSSCDECKVVFRYYCREWYTIHEQTCSKFPAC